MPKGPRLIVHLGWYVEQSNLFSAIQYIAVSRMSLIFQFYVECEVYFDFNYDFVSNLSSNESNKIIRKLVLQVKVILLYHEQSSFHVSTFSSLFTYCDSIFFVTSTLYERERVTFWLRINNWNWIKVLHKQENYIFMLFY